MAGASPRKAKKPIASVNVVTNRTEARAGLILNYSSRVGITMPPSAAVIGVRTMATAITTDSFVAPNQSEATPAPCARPLPPALRASIRERVARQPGAEILQMAESDIEHGFGTEVVLVVEGPVAESLRLDLLRMIRRERGLQEPARVLIVPAASISDQDR